MTETARRDEGHLSVALVVVLLAVAALGVGMLRYSGLPVLRAAAVTGADAAALAGMERLRTDLTAPDVALLATGYPSLDALQRSADLTAEDWARRNDTRILSSSLRRDGDDGLVYTARVETDETFETGDRGGAEAEARLGWKLVPVGDGGCMELSEVQALARGAGLPEPSRSGLVECRGRDARNLQPVMKVAILKIEKVLREQPGARRGGPPIVLLYSAYRSIEEQARLHVGCLNGTSGCPAAPPGRSLHQYGMAIDVQNYRAVEAAIGVDPSIGLCNEVPDDAVHFSPVTHRECGGSAALPPPGYTVEFERVRLVG